MKPQIVPVLVVLPPRTLLLDVAGPIEVLRKANFVQQRLRFDVSFVGATPALESSIGLVLSGIGPLPDRVPDGAMVIVAGATDDMMSGARHGGRAEAAQEKQIVRWLVHAIRPGVTLVTICSAALLAARAGLLDNYDCTTHHACCEELARLAPAARIFDNRLYVEDRERLSSAGVTSGIDLMLHIVARLAGAAAAQAVARYLVVYVRRGGADPQLSPWLEGRNHLHPAIHRVQDAIAAEPASDWSLERLGAVAAASPRHLSRLFNEHTGMSVTDYVNRMRIALADELIAQTRLDMERVAERAGFASTRQFRRAWNRFHDLPPARTRRTAAEPPP